MCWAHMMKNSQMRLRVILKKKDQLNDCMNDLRSLHRAPTKQIFDIGIALFDAKWRTVVNGAVMEYLNVMWFTSHRNWYAGATLGLNVPLTNNCLESFNNIIKEEGTLRTRMEFGLFLTTMKERMSYWSKGTLYAEELDIPDSLWKDAVASSNGTPPKSVGSKNMLRALFTTSGTLTVAQVRAYKTIKFADFKEFAKHMDNTHDAKVDPKNWRSNSCTCKEYILRYNCVHVLDLALRNKLTTPQFAVKQNKILDKPKRGRPKRAAHALVRD